MHRPQRLIHIVNRKHEIAVRPRVVRLQPDAAAVKRRFRREQGVQPPYKASYNALLQLAAALICWRQTLAIYG
jgi:hypothetical protein